MRRHFGVLIPSTNTTVEIEYNRLLPPTLQVHVGRLGQGLDTPFSPSRPADISYQARMLGTAKVEVVCLAQTSASLFDDDYDATTTQQMTAGAGVPSLTSAQAIGQAVRALGARRIALVSPYSQDVIGRARWYFESRYGVEVVAMEGFGATDSYAISTIALTTPPPLLHAWTGQRSRSWSCREGTFPPCAALPPGSSSSISQ